MRPIVPVCKDGQYFNAPVREALEMGSASERKWKEGGNPHNNHQKATAVATLRSSREPLRHMHIDTQSQTRETH